MRPLAVLLAAACLAPSVAPGHARADEATPVVLELYTSQGCSSCPPADALFAELAKRDDVIALALHVDYWDYLGWKDVFARPRHTARQKAYAKAARSRTIFTPEMIVQGEERLKGHDAAAILEEIAVRDHEAPGAALSLDREGDELRIGIAPAATDAATDAGTGVAAARSAGGSIGTPVAEAASGALSEARSFAAAPDGATGASAVAADVHVVRFVPEEEVLIEGGENAGQTVTYNNIVTDWQTIGQWDGRSAADFVYRGTGDGPLAVIVQRVRMGPIIAAGLAP